MNKKVFFSLAVFLVGGIPFFVSAQSGTNYDWQEITSCMDFNKQLKHLLKHENLKENHFEFKNEIVPFFNLWENKNSTAFFTLYDEKSHLLTLVQWPKEVGSSLINFNSVKKVAKIRLPKTFSQVSTQIFGEKLLLITASQKIKGQNESFLLIYEISNNKLKPVHLFKQTGKIAKTQIQNEKFYLITVEDIQKSTLQAVVQHKIPETDLFPMLSQGLAYGLPMTWSKARVCRGLKYFFDNKLPKVWSFLVVDLNSPTQERESATLFWNFEDFVFSKDFLYTSQSSKETETLIQRFSLEPKLNYQKSAVLSGEMIVNGIIPRGSKSSFITTLSSGKFIRYLVSNFDSQFSEVGSKELLSGNVHFDAAEVIEDQLFFTTKTEAILATRELGKGSSAVNPPLHIEWNQKILLTETPLSFLAIEESGEKISFSFVNERNWTLQTKKVLFYTQWGKIIGTPLRDKEKQILCLVVQKDGIFSLKGFTIDKNRQQIKEIFFRKYVWASAKPLQVAVLSDFAYVVFEKYVDIFLPNQAKNMKILK